MELKTRFVFCLMLYLSMQQSFAQLTEAQKQASWSALLKYCNRSHDEIVTKEQFNDYNERWKSGITYNGDKTELAYEDYKKLMWGESERCARRTRITLHQDFAPLIEEQKQANWNALLKLFDRSDVETVTKEEFNDYNERWQSGITYNGDKTELAYEDYKQLV